jgi:hypothetical protein
MIFCLDPAHLYSHLLSHPVCHLFCSRYQPLCYDITVSGSSAITTGLQLSLLFAAVVKSLLCINYDKIGSHNNDGD